MSNRQRGSRVVAGIVALIACGGVWIVGRAPAPLARGIVATFHPLATDAGVEMFNRGGNAFDAFVAATLAEFVVNEGGACPRRLNRRAGLRGEDREDGVSRRGVQRRARSGWPVGCPQAVDGVGSRGRQGGARARRDRWPRSTVEAVGRKSFADALQRAIALARNGFTVEGFYRSSLVTWAASRPGRTPAAPSIQTAVPWHPDRCCGSRSWRHFSKASLATARLHVNGGVGGCVRGRGPRCKAGCCPRRISPRIVRPGANRGPSNTAATKCVLDRAGHSDRSGAWSP